MKKYSFLLICLALSFSAMSQKAVISFAEKSFDFGKIYEKDGNATHVFEFVNKGDGPLVINRVQTSCGCTTPSWTKEPIAPGKNGTITVTYTTAGHSDFFQKTITVYSNDENEQTVLIIKGTLIPISATNPPAINSPAENKPTK